MAGRRLENVTTCGKPHAVAFRLAAASLATQAAALGWQGFAGSLPPEGAAAPFRAIYHGGRPRPSSGPGSMACGGSWGLMLSSSSHRLPVALVLPSRPVPICLTLAVWFLYCRAARVML